MAEAGDRETLPTDIVIVGGSIIKAADVTKAARNVRDAIDRPTEKPVGAGEAACTTVGPALANAVYNATGARLRTVPFTPERVWRALQRESGSATAGATPAAASSINEPVRA